MKKNNMSDFLNKVICGDCLEVMRQMPDESVDLIITSPPYNLKNSTGGGMRSGYHGGKWGNAALKDGYTSHGDNMPHEEYVEWQRRCLLEMMRLLKDTGAIFYNHKRRVQGGLMQDRDDVLNGFPVRQIIIWARGSGINMNDTYFVPTYENIYMIVKPDFKLKKMANRYGDVWWFPPARGNPHPAPFPYALPDRIIKSVDAEVIMDPFCGSGTTLVAAQSNGRRYIGIDNSEEYCEMTRDRLSCKL